MVFPVVVASEVTVPRVATVGAYVEAVSHRYLLGRAPRCVLGLGLRSRWLGVGGVVGRR
ncbi:MAG: hypothetical protein HN986_08550, partial [Candidatus Marinimicrobia bacterium]|nr:hypothetical protein [Candidatus Neomarinimicrobiota bacterium]